LLLYSSYVPFGVPNGTVIYINTAATSNSVQLLKAVVMVLLKTSPSSWRGGEVRMETKISGDTPARNYRRFSDLRIQMGKKV
jgi:hypothetical protein